jgi:hypothetical protein
LQSCDFLFEMLIVSLKCGNPIEQRLYGSLYFLID